MKKYVSILILMIASMSCLAQAQDRNIELVYSEFKFKLPKGQVTTVASMGGEDDILVFKYSNELGKKYVAFTNMSNDSSINWGCELSVFYKDAFLGNTNSDCKKSELEAFNKVFLKENDSGVWGRNGHSVYYIIGDKNVVLFVVNPSGIVIKIDSDFLRKSGLKNIASVYID